MERGGKLPSLKESENPTLCFLYGVDLSWQGPDSFVAWHLWPHPGLVNGFLYTPQEQGSTKVFPRILESKLENSRQAGNCLSQS